tara:strand:+ start:51197 stop:51445 length:249 start_codon:yes stop_codon:yes gene_type:complete
VKIFYFASLRQIVGTSEENFKIDRSYTVKDLIQLLRKRDENFKIAFKDLSKIKCAVNRQYVSLEKLITDEDEISFFPPVTGG